MPTLHDGRQVDSASEEWRHECEARAIAALPTLGQRRAWLDAIEHKRGKVAADALRATMPETAALVDALRQVWGAERTDELLRTARRGWAVFYAAELGADGVLREWGWAPSGRRARVVGGVVVMPGVPKCSS